MQDNYGLIRFWPDRMLMLISGPGIKQKVWTTWCVSMFKWSSNNRMVCPKVPPKSYINSRI